MRGTRAILMGPCARVDARFRKFVRNLHLGKRKSDLLIGVDGGTEVWLKLGIHPDLAIGDWDSLSSRNVLETLAFVPLPEDKGRSDFWHALQETKRRGVREVICLGLSGGRADHHWAVVMDLAEFAGSAGGVEKLTLLDPETSWHFISNRSKSWKVDLQVGQIVSVFALPSPARGSHVKIARGIEFKGLKFNPPGGILPVTPGSQGLSNVAVRRKCEIRVRFGVLMVIMPTGLIDKNVRTTGKGRRTARRV